MSSRLGFARAAHGVSALLLSLVILASTWAFFIAADQEGPAGVTEGFSIVALPPEESGAATLHSAIRGAAEREQVNIYKVTPSLEGEAVGQDYFAFTGNDDALLGDLATGSFPAFSRGFPAQLHPAEELTPEQHLGLYMIQGSPDAAESVRAALQGEGLELTPASTPPMLVLWAAHLVTGGWGTATLTLWAALLLTSANLLSVRLGIHGLRRATGSSALHATSLDAAAVLLPAALSAALPTAVLLIHSLVRADGYRAPSILVTGLSTAVLVLSASAAAIAVIMLLMLRRDVGAVLKGARPVRTLGVLSVTVLLLSTCAMGAGTIAAIHHSQEDQWAQEAHDYLTARPEVFSVLGSFALSGQQGDALNDGLGAAYRDLEPRRQATLMTSTLLEEVTATDPHRQAHRTLLTDSGFLSTLTGAPPALEDEVVRITSQEGGVAVIIPRTLEAESARITEDVEQILSFQAGLRPDDQRVDARVVAVPAIDLGVVPFLDLEPGSTERTFAVDPVLVVTDAAGGVLPDSFYGSFGLFTDAAALDREIEKRNLELVVAGTVRVSELAAYDQAERAASARVRTAGNITMAIALVIASALLAAVQFSRTTAAIFLRMSTGSSFLRIHRTFLLVVAALSAASTATGTLLTGSSAPTASVISIVVAALTVLIAAAVLATLSRTLTHDALETT